MVFLLSKKEALAMIAVNGTVVLESRKYGIVADWWRARNKDEFATWLRKRVGEGAYPEDEYGRTWRCWSVPPTEAERRASPWPRSTAMPE